MNIRVAFKQKHRHNFFPNTLISCPSHHLRHTAVKSWFISCWNRLISSKPCLPFEPPESQCQNEWAGNLQHAHTRTHTEPTKELNAFLFIIVIQTKLTYGWKVQFSVVPLDHCQINVTMVTNMSIKWSPQGAVIIVTEPAVLMWLDVCVCVCVLDSLQLYLQR